MFVNQKTLVKKSEVYETLKPIFFKLNNIKLKPLFTQVQNDSSQYFYKYLDNILNTNLGSQIVKGKFYEDSSGKIFMVLKVGVKSIHFSRLTKVFKKSINANRICFNNRVYPFIYIYHYNYMRIIDKYDMAKLGLRLVNFEEIQFSECY